MCSETSSRAALGPIRCRTAAGRTSGPSTTSLNVSLALPPAPRVLSRSVFLSRSHNGVWFRTQWRYVVFAFSEEFLLCAMARMWCCAFPPTDILKLTSRSLGPSRCYGFWQEVLGCYVVNSGEGETGKKKCMPALEDYYECLHHKKEVRSRLAE